MKLDNVAKILQEKNNIEILTHHYPDGDTLGSAYGLCKALQDMGKNARVILSGKAATKFDYLKNGVKEKSFTPEFIMSVDLANYPTNYAVLCQINQIVQDGFSLTAGRIRSVPVTIGGSTYIPPIPFEDQIKQELNDLLNNEEGIDLAIDLVLYVMKRQLFLDGNKRTAVIFSNHYLISHALGLLVVPADKVDEYKKVLVSYYEDESKKPDIAAFLKEKCWIKMN